MSLLLFIALTFTISLAAFLFIRAIPAAHSPENPSGLPLWLVMVWGPSLAAIVLAVWLGDPGRLLARVVQIRGVAPLAWVFSIAPLLLLWGMAVRSPSNQPSALSFKAALAMVALNLVLGPLGEELGWRGVMQHQLAAQYGWFWAALMVGVVWFVWHIPLWWIDSPQAQIPMALFGGHCMAYAVILGGVYELSSGSLVPVILGHLSVNLAANLALYCGYHEAKMWFAHSLLPFFALAALVCAAVQM